MELKKDIVTACLLFRDNNYSFPYSTFVTTKFSTVDKNRKKELFEEFQNRKINNFVEALAQRFQITIHFVHNDDTIKSGEYGRELFMRQNDHLFWFHSNCGRMINLPAGVNKFQGCIHRLDEILDHCKVKKCKLSICPLRFDTDLKSIEKKYKVSFNIWQKTKKTCPLRSNQFEIQNIRRGKKSKNQINLHHDPIFNKLFLITDKTLYFRSFIRKLKIK